MPNYESLLGHFATRRQILGAAVSGVAALFIPGIRSALAAEVLKPAKIETVNPTAAKRELTQEMSQRFGLVFPESTIPEGRDLPLYANLYQALLIYENVGLTNFSNTHTGNLHFVVNSEGKTLSEKTPFQSAVAYYWNDGISQIVFRWPQEGPPPDWWQPDSNIGQATNLEPLHNIRATVYALHELFHPLQHRNIAPTTTYNHSQVILTPDMQDFAEATGIKIISGESDIKNKPPWELNYEYPEVGSWRESLREFDWRAGDGTSPIVEGSAVSLSQLLWNRDIFSDKFPNHARWAVAEIDRLKAA